MHVFFFSFFSKTEVTKAGCLGLPLIKLLSNAPQKMLAKLLMSKVVSCRCSFFFPEDLLLYFVPKKICMDFAMVA